MKKEDVDARSLQENLDYVIDNLVKQGERCIQGKGTGCVYGNGIGQHCAVGWLLDEDNKLLMEFMGGVSALLSTWGNLTEYIPNTLKTNCILFVTLQSFHDSAMKSRRKSHLKYLITGYPKLSFTNPNWQKWVEMGE